MHTIFCAVSSLCLNLSMFSVLLWPSQTPQIFPSLSLSLSHPVYPQSLRFFNKNRLQLLDTVSVEIRPLSGLITISLDNTCSWRTCVFYTHTVVCASCEVCQVCDQSVSPWVRSVLLLKFTAPSWTLCHTNKKSRVEKKKSVMPSTWKLQCVHEHKHAHTAEQWVDWRNDPEVIWERLLHSFVGKTRGHLWFNVAQSIREITK